MLGLLPYLIAFILLALLFFSVVPKLEKRWPRFAFERWASGFAIFIAVCSLIHSVGVQREQEKSRRPNLRATVNSVEFPTFNQTIAVTSGGFFGVENPGTISFDLSIENWGTQDTMLVACWLVKEGESRDKAFSLDLDQGDLLVPGNQRVRLGLKFQNERIEDFRNLKVTLILRDAAGREFPTTVILRHTSFGTRIADIPVNTN